MDDIKDNISNSESNNIENEDKNKKRKLFKTKDKNKSEIDYSITPKQVKWNWGAAIFPLYFGIGCHSWLCILSVIPILNLIWWVVCGMLGAKWAWKSKYFSSEDEFNKTMKTWNTAGFVGLIVKIILLIILILISDFVIGLAAAGATAISTNFGIEKIIDVIVAVLKVFIGV